MAIAIHYMLVSFLHACLWLPTMLVYSYLQADIHICMGHEKLFICMHIGSTHTHGIGHKYMGNIHITWYRIGAIANR